MTTLRLAASLPSFASDDPGDWQFLLDLARDADRAGIDRVLASDHVVYGENLEAYARPELGGQVGGKQPIGPDGHWLEPLTVLSTVAGITSRVRLGTSILLAALRRPIVLSKTLSTLDVLSNGRLDIGVGVGWQKEEYDAAGLSFDDRGRQLDHTLAVMQTVWRNPRAEYRDDRLSFDKIHQMPKPRQAGGVPLWISGTANKAVARRIAQFGSGWIPWGPAAADIAGGITQMRELVETAGGSFDSVRVVTTLKIQRGGSGEIDFKQTMAPVPDLAARGVTDFNLGHPVTMQILEDLASAYDLYAAAVAAFRAAQS